MEEEQGVMNAAHMQMLKDLDEVMPEKEWELNTFLQEDKIVFVLGFRQGDYIMSVAESSDPFAIMDVAAALIRLQRHRDGVSDPTYHEVDEDGNLKEMEIN